MFASRLSGVCEGRRGRKEEAGKGPSYKERPRERGTGYRPGLEVGRGLWDRMLRPRAGELPSLLVTPTLQHVSPMLILAWLTMTCWTIQFILAILPLLNLYVYMCALVCGFVHVSVGAQRDQNRGSDSLEVELQAVVSCPMRVLGTEPQVLCKSSMHSYYRAISPGP